MVAFGRGVLHIAGVTLAVAGNATGGREVSTLELVKGFHGWMKGNAKPVRLASKFDLLCAPASPKMVQRKQKKEPTFSALLHT